MKSASIRISKRAIVLYPTIRGERGLRVPAPPFELLDLKSSRAELAALLRGALDASLKTLPKAPKNHGAKVLELTGLRSSAGGASCKVTFDPGTGLFRLVPGRPKNGGHVGVKEGALLIDSKAGDEVLGQALVEIISKAKTFARISD